MLKKLLRVSVMSEPEDEWDDETNDGNVIDGECDHCGRYTKITKDSDPFVRDVYPEDENEESWWCRSCYEARMDDI
jgi:hypothetical protein